MEMGDGRDGDVFDIVNRRGWCLVLSRKGVSHGMSVSLSVVCVSWGMSIFSVCVSRPHWPRVVTSLA